MYYSEITCNGVTEIEAHMQIISICEQWYNLAHPQGDFVRYFKRHPDLLYIEKWPCFVKLEQ
jgi:hypothetical protein